MFAPGALVKLKHPCTFATNNGTGVIDVSINSVIMIVDIIAVFRRSGKFYTVRFLCEGNLIKLTVYNLRKLFFDV
jgi:hypothetical protein